MEEKTGSTDTRHLRSTSSFPETVPESLPRTLYNLPLTPPFAATYDRSTLDRLLFTSNVNHLEEPLGWVGVETERT